ncbi:MAG TPA: hypothetical protein VGC87_00770 [Pyrinomonadaceae bacterium]|jgi:hypothetical protein
MRRFTVAGFTLLWALALTTASSSRAAYSQEAAPQQENQESLSWTKDYSLIVTNNATLAQAVETANFINSNGGQVAVVVSPRMMLGWAPSTLVGKERITAVHQRALNPALFAAKNQEESDTLKFYNQVASGQWRARKETLKSSSPSMEFHGEADGLEPPTTSLKPAGSGVSESIPGNSDIMVGIINFNAIFVESNGLLDPNTYTWTCASMSTIVGELSAGFSFWSSRAAAYGVPLTWVPTYHRPAVAGGCAGTASVTTRYEPILRPSNPGAATGGNGDNLWINEIMGKFGFASGDKFARVNAFNSARRAATGANWATTSFIAYNPPPAPTSFSDDRFAYAYRTGPYSQLLYANDGWGVSNYDIVHAHETGHLFGAYDEYSESGCTNCATGDAAAKDCVNGNCSNCTSSVACIMRSNEMALCGYTPGAIGWGAKLTYAKTARSNSLIEKTNFKPGQPVRYLVRMELPGKAGECMTVVSRWYRQFPGGVTEAESFTSPCLAQTGGAWLIWLERTVPAGAKFGEASFEVQFEFNYSTAPNKYAKGTRSSDRGRFFIQTTGANASVASPEPGGGGIVVVDPGGPAPRSAPARQP